MTEQHQNCPVCGASFPAITKVGPFAYKNGVRAVGVRETFCSMSCTIIAARKAELAMSEIFAKQLAGGTITMPIPAEPFRYDSL
jgi:predicted nucleic acid-binding Zn ribbon protein